MDAGIREEGLRIISHVREQHGCSSSSSSRQTTSF